MSRISATAIAAESVEGSSRRSRTGRSTTSKVMLASSTSLDGFVTGPDVRIVEAMSESGDGQPLLLETTRTDVSATGDVRCGSTKRVASAVGNGALDVRSLREAPAGPSRL